MKESNESWWQNLWGVGDTAIIETIDLCFPKYDQLQWNNDISVLFWPIHSEGNLFWMTGDLQGTQGQKRGRDPGEACFQAEDVKKKVIILPPCCFRMHLWIRVSASVVFNCARLGAWFLTRKAKKGGHPNTIVSRKTFLFTRLCLAVTQTNGTVGTVGKSTPSPLDGSPKTIHQPPADPSSLSSIPPTPRSSLHCYFLQWANGLSEARRAVILLQGKLGDKLRLTGTSGLAGAPIIRSMPTDSLFQIDVPLGWRGSVVGVRIIKTLRRYLQAVVVSAIGLENYIPLSFWFVGRKHGWFVRILYLWLGICRFKSELHGAIS